jgi:hypothetical protein
MSCFIAQSLYSFTQVATQNPIKECFFFMPARLGSFVMSLRDFENMLPTPATNNGQLGTVVFLG